MNLNRFSSFFQHIQVIFLILAAILHLANIAFVPIEETDGVSVADEYPLHAVAKLLGVDDEVELTEALISNVSTIKGKKKLDMCLITAQILNYCL